MHIYKVTVGVITDDDDDDLDLSGLKVTKSII